MRATSTEKKTRAPGTRYRLRGMARDADTEEQERAMTTTNPPPAKPTVIEALSSVMAEVQAVGKQDRNNEQGYNFRGVDAVVNAVGPVFRKYGIVAVPVKSEAKYRDVLTSREKRSRECTVAVTYRFYGPAGDYIECEVPGESMDFGDKGAPKAMSVAYRIALLQTLCIPTHEPEPDAQTYERAAEPVWDPDEQETLLAGWLAEIEDATTGPELSDIGRRLLEERRTLKLSPDAYARAAKRGKERAGELNGKVNGTVIGASA